MSIADSRDDATTTVKQHSGRIGMTGKLILAGITLLVAGGIVGGVVAYEHSQKGKDEGPPPASPPPLQPGAVTESVSAKELTLVLKVSGERCRWPVRERRVYSKLQK